MPKILRVEFLAGSVKRPGIHAVTWDSSWDACDRDVVPSDLLGRCVTRFGSLDEVAGCGKVRRAVDLKGRKPCVVLALGRLPVGLGVTTSVAVGRKAIDRCLHSLISER